MEARVPADNAPALIATLGAIVTLVVVVVVVGATLAANLADTWTVALVLAELAFAISTIWWIMRTGNRRGTHRKCKAHI
jgi:hypothetical protein